MDTREDLETTARELGIKFQPSIKDATLRKKVKAAQDKAASATSEQDQGTGQGTGQAQSTDAPQAYIALINIRHNGAKIDEGATVTLTSDEAAPLLAVKALAPAPSDPS